MLDEHMGFPSMLEDTSGSVLRVEDAGWHVQSLENGISSSGAFATFRAGKEFHRKLRFFLIVAIVDCHLKRAIVERSHVVQRHICRAHRVR
jgi:hypothetical protein